MFQSARIKLTLWYLVIIMAVSGFFSIIAYMGFTKELGRGFRFQAQTVTQKRILVQERNGFLRILPFVIYEDEIPPQEYYEIITLAKKRFASQLLIINGGILFLAGTAGYFLAGKTLRPIEQMVSEQKRFVADASHELRTPLTTIRTETEVALRDKKLKIKDAKNLMKSTLEEVDKMKYFTDNLLSLSKYEGGGKDLAFEKVNLKKAFANAIDKNLKLAKTKKIKILSDLADVEIKGNFQSLTELFSTLINNAIKYSREGKNLHLKTFKRRRLVVAEVKDEGIGINAEDIPNIFDRFYRADSSRCKTEVEGYGLGLAIAKSIVELHKGEIKVESKVGKGTSFKIFLPA